MDGITFSFNDNEHETLIDIVSAEVKAQAKLIEQIEKEPDPISTGLLPSFRQRLAELRALEKKLGGE